MAELARFRLYSTGVCLGISWVTTCSVYVILVVVIGVLRCFACDTSGWTVRYCPVPCMALICGLRTVR